MSFPNNGTQVRRKSTAALEFRILKEFKKSCENHAQLTSQIRGLLNALGDGQLASRALKNLDEKFKEISGMLERATKKSDPMKPRDLWKSLDDCKKAALAVRDTFNELGVFDNKFFSSLRDTIRQLEVISAKLDIEYGTLPECQLDLYLVSTFEPLMSSIETFLEGLTSLAEKDIEKIRQAQDQRDQNLTTVSTFLSGVTASTLQITSLENDVPLTTIINTLWFVSLVFSTASAIYSLLSSTWRQSSVYRPDLALPTLVIASFHNGPMYALIAALFTFSMGLCLLAFHVAELEGSLLLAAIPVAFAAIHVLSLSLFSAQLWAMLTKGWKKVKGLKSSGINAGPIRLQEQQQSSALFALVTSLFKNSDSDSTSDIERGAYSNDDATPEVDRSDVKLDRLEAKPRRLIQFSPDGHLLACAYKDRVVIYGVDKAFSVLDTITMPDESTVEEISWKSRQFPINDIRRGAILKGASSALHYDNHEERLLLKSARSISIWNITNKESTQSIQVNMRGLLTGEYTFAEWVDENTQNSTATRIGSFVCGTGPIVRRFNEMCKEFRSASLPDLTINGSTLNVSRVLGATILHGKFLVCLVETMSASKSMPHPDCVIVFDMKERAILSKRVVMHGHTSISLHRDSKRILLHGGHHRVEIVELLDSELGRNPIKEVCTLWRKVNHGHEAVPPETSVTFHGHDDKMIVAYSEDEVVMLYNIPGDDKLSALHIFSTPTPQALPSDCSGFAINPASSALPYMLAFRSEQGFITIWSIQSNRGLSENEHSEIFEVHDNCNGRGNDPIKSDGRFLAISPPLFVPPGNRGSQQALDKKSQVQPTQ